MKKLLLLIVFCVITHSIFAQGVWTAKANCPAGNVSELRAFSIGNYAYVGGNSPDLWRHDPVADIWTQMAAFPAATRPSSVAFSIGNKGYFGTGGAFNDFYEYDPATNAWTTKAMFGGSGREGAVGISINGKGYIGTGGSYLNDWWEYDSTANTWTQKANLAGPGRYHAGAFAINGKGYISCGFNGTFFNDLWEYDPSLNTWTAKATMPGSTRDRPVGLATTSKGYIIAGWTGTMPLNDAWEYDPVNDAWVALPSVPTAGYYNSCGVSVGTKVYTGTGIGIQSQWWEFGPDCSAQATANPVSCVGSCDGSAQLTAPDPGSVVSYLWSNGNATSFIQNVCPGSYTVTVTDTAGCISSLIVEVPVAPALPITSQITTPLCAGDLTGEICVSLLGNPISQVIWSTGDTTTCISNLAAGAYTVTVTDTAGCAGVDTISVTQPAPITINFNELDATCATCPNGSAAAQMVGGTAPASYQWSTGSTLAYLGNLIPGTYTCCITDANGCTACDSVVVNYTVGINEPGDHTIQITPNPFHDQLTIEFSGNFANNSVRIYDIAGREVYFVPEVTGTKININTAYLQGGMYFVKISGSSGVRNFKLLKE